MLFSRREWIKTTSTALALSPLAGIPDDGINATYRNEQEATWSEIVTFFDSLSGVEKGWQTQSRLIRQNFILRIPFEGKSPMELENLAGKFVRSRYDHRGELLWYCLHMDERLVNVAPWIAR